MENAFEMQIIGGHIYHDLNLPIHVLTGFWTYLSV